MATTILLADDHPLFRKGLRALLDEQRDFTVVGEADDGQETIDMVRTLLPDIVIMDIAMPNLNGIDATRTIISEHPSVKVVALSMHSGRRFVEGMLQAGATGYILKKSVPEDIVACLKTVREGENFLSPAITNIVVAEFKDSLSRSPSQAKERDALLILRTKLRPPQLPLDIVPRPELMTRLDAAIGRLFTLVSSGAGCGKSTTAALWLEGRKDPFAWLTLDDEDNDLIKFVHYLLAAIENAFPETCNEIRSLMYGPKLLRASEIGQHLVNALEDIEVPFILVLDDFHKVRNSAIRDLIRFILTHPPKNLRLMILTRRDPILLTSTLRRKGQMDEICSADMHFSVAETTDFLKKTLGFEIEKKAVGEIHEKLEGWPAGIRLISQPLKRPGAVDSLLSSLKGGFATIVDYLVSEVLSHQSPGMAKLMTATAIPERFCASLCDVIVGFATESGVDVMNGDEFIARLQRDNLFLIALDTESQWFRYHPLFQQLLKGQLERYWCPEEVANLHSTIHQWSATKDLIDSDVADIGVTEANDYLGASADQPQRSPVHSDALIEPLSSRELDVLELLSQRMSNKEIAERLFIATTTVKGHLQNIYQKLNVNKRREAVEKANRLKLF